MSDLFCFLSYSKGFGIIGKILGEDHILNLPNSYMGLIFFPIMLILGMQHTMMTGMCG